MTPQERAIPISSSTLGKLAQGPNTRAWLKEWARRRKPEHAALLRPLGSCQHLEQDRVLASDPRAFAQARKAECQRLASDAQPLAAYSASAVAAMLSLQELDDPDQAWKLVPEGQQNHLLALAGQLRPIELPEFDPPLRGLDLALAGAAIEYLSPVDLIALGWLIEAGPSSRWSGAHGNSGRRRGKAPEQKLERALQQDLWRDLLPGSCSEEAAASCHQALAERIEVVPGAGGQGEMEWSEIAWPGSKALPGEGEMLDELAGAEMLRLLSELSRGQLPERGSRDAYGGSEGGQLHHISLHWGPWRGLGAPPGMAMLMLVQPAEQHQLGAGQRGQVHIAFARRGT